MVIGPLDKIRENSGAVVLGEDLNSSGHDATPTSIRHEFLKRVRDYRFWVKEAIFWVVPVPFAGLIDYPLNYFKHYHDPTAVNVHFVAPNREEHLFQIAREFHFGDGGTFDFGGDTTRTLHHRGRTLAQSNQRAWKGFAPTFFFRRTYLHLVGSYKLDWFFVKPARLNGTMLWPFYGRTLKDLNASLKRRTSDHCPITVGLPLQDGMLLQGGSEKDHGPS